MKIWDLATRLYHWSQVLLFIAAKPKDSNNLSCHLCRYQHRLTSPQRSFSDDRPASASTTAMIQNRMTMVDSAQPLRSK